ncbi:alkaline phosphatase-like isoform X3 [Apis cerana]|uniref:alkaline phosphatase-like isoform X3 n=1 Tax=Apis cerana TaxID=7461 RepID=UPI002B237D89|nr:alkaline phosphatase-like isoform X3 [Apis cerana]
MWRYLQYTIFGLTVVLLTIHEIVFVQAGEQERVAWYEGATRAIEGRIRASAATWSAPAAGGVARGVVLFVGDGMGMSTLTAARILSGQRRGNTGEEAQLAWDSFPAVALARTYNMDAQVGESSACATALLCGVKANYETVGLDSSARFENCYSSFDARVPSLINWAQEQGKSTGLVTTTRVTHATPAALYAHAASRYWEDDGKVPPAARTSCKDIARQLLEDEPGRNINVILGGGRRHFVPKVTQDPEEPDKEGRRLDGRNLIEEWSRNHRLRNVAAKYVANKEQFESVDPRKVNHLLGLFSYSHMDFDVDRNTNGSGDPSLAEMTIKALRILAKNPEGYFLFVEGGRIDHAHHYNNAYRALDETLALEEAVRAVMKEVDLSETLLVVTADHSHVLTLGGLATHRGNPIFAREELEEERRGNDVLKRQNETLKETLGDIRRQMSMLVKGGIRGKSGETSTRGGIFVGEEAGRRKGRKRGFDGWNDRGCDRFKTGGRSCCGYDAAIDLESREDRDVDAAERTIDENPVSIAEISINQSIVTESKTEFQQIAQIAIAPLFA